MPHDLQNPRTKNYSKLRSFLVAIEVFLKKGYLFIFLIVNFFFHSKKKEYIDLQNYKNLDTRFINYLFKSLNKKYNFSYNFSFGIIDFVKKIGVKNFITYCTPNFFAKKNERLRFVLNKEIFSQEEINFNTNYFTKYNNEKLFLPYYIYPRAYNDNYNNLEKYKNNKKNIKIFFSGSTNKEVYGKFSWNYEGNIKLLNRVEIINFVIENFKDKIFFLKSYEDLKKIDFINKPIILSINDGLVKKTKTNLTNSQHFELISKSNFILTAPGGDMPLCHHLIEGIKMNAIPISNYAYLHKPQINENNYLHFSDYNSLKESINRALNMSDDEIRLKQNNLENFYKNFLSPSSFFEAFENRKSNEIVACNDIESLNWL